MLKLSNVTVIYPDGTKAVDNIDLTVNAGENIALIGGNGAEDHASACDSRDT